VIVIFNMAPKEEETEDIFTQADLEGMERKELQLYAAAYDITANGKTKLLINALVGMESRGSMKVRRKN